MATSQSRSAAISVMVPMPSRAPTTRSPSGSSPRNWSAGSLPQPPGSMNKCPHQWHANNRNNFKHNKWLNFALYQTYLQFFKFKPVCLNKTLFVLSMTQKMYSLRDYPYLTLNVFVKVISEMGSGFLLDLGIDFENNFPEESVFQSSPYSCGIIFD